MDPIGLHKRLPLTIPAVRTINLYEKKSCEWQVGL